MRKSVKLAAATTLAAMAMVGASATAASAGGRDHDRGRGDQFCAAGVNVNSVEAEDKSWASVKTESEDANLNVLNCQNGEDNRARQDVDADVAAEIEESFNKEDDRKRHGKKKHGGYGKW